MLNENYPTVGKTADAVEITIPFMLGMKFLFTGKHANTATWVILGLLGIFAVGLAIKYFRES